MRSYVVFRPARMMIARAYIDFMDALIIPKLTRIAVAIACKDFVA